MTIIYKKRRLIRNLIFGLLWLLLSLLSFIFSEQKPLFYNSWTLLLAVMYLSLYFYEKKYQYITIENGVLTLHSLLSKKVQLNQIKSVVRFAGDYKLKTDTSELIINTNYIDEESLKDLDSVLLKLNLN